MGQTRTRQHFSNQSISPEGVQFFSWPVYANFGKGRFHSYGVSGSFDLCRLSREHSKSVVRTEVIAGRRGGLRRVLIRFCDDTWCLADERHLTVYSADRICSELLAGEIRRRYEKTQEDPCFHVIRNKCDLLYTQDVPLRKGADMSEAELALHYGDDFKTWMNGWLDRFESTSSGLTLFRGEPGTGKTTFIRQLIRRMMGTHQFYFIPISMAAKLSQPAMVDFWLDESQSSKGRQLVAIFEDAELLLAPREDGDPALVSEMLNAADGLLGDCLRLQIIATVNCPLDRLDAAVTRPGRMIGFREFRRLNRKEAEALAARKGIQIPEKDSLSLAEIYSQPAAPRDLTRHGRSIGFAASMD